MAQALWKPSHLAQRAAILLALLFAPSLVLATAQQGDILIFEGKKYIIYTNPLERFLETSDRQVPKSNTISTGNWRGYVATWEITQNQLVLRDIEIFADRNREDLHGPEDEYRSVLAEVFPDQSFIIADWFTGYLIVPTGKLKEYVHMGYASTYDQYVVLTIRNGAVLPARAARACRVLTISERSVRGL